MPSGRHQRKWSNYLLDKKLQLRYTLLVTALAFVIAASLGAMIYHQKRVASASIEADMQTLMASDSNNQEFAQQIAAGLQSEDRSLIYIMVGVGCGLVIILSAYLVIMTHKVAGPLYKVSMYFERMKEGRLGKVTPLRRGDMLQDFYDNFHTMHDAVRARATADHEQMMAAAEKLRAQAGKSPKLAAELELFEAHLAERKQQLA